MLEISMELSVFVLTISFRISSIHEFVIFFQQTARYFALACGIFYGFKRRSKYHLINGLTKWLWYCFMIILSLGHQTIDVSIFFIIFMAWLDISFPLRQKLNFSRISVTYSQESSNFSLACHMLGMNFVWCTELYYTCRASVRKCHGCWGEGCTKWDEGLRAALGPSRSRVGPGMGGGGHIVNVPCR